MKKLFLFTIFCTVLTPALLFAQGEQLEEVFAVTGSYIGGAGEEGASPVEIKTREDLNLAGNPDIVEMLRSLGPVSGIDGESNFFQSNGLSGVSNVNLRGLGPGRTLVLLNGSRIVPHPFFIQEGGQQFANTNAIPSIALQQVELLKEGASATYGSDAVAGVVSFLTRSDFRGLEFEGSYKNVPDSEFPDHELGMIAGMGADRLDLVIAGGYRRRGEVPVADRDWALTSFQENSTPGGWSAIGNPVTLYPRAAPGFVPDPDCDTVGGSNQRGFCRFRYTDFFNIAEDEEHYQIFSELNYELTERAVFNADFLYANNRSAAKTSPSYPPQSLLGGDQIVVPGMPHFDDFLARNPQLDPADWAAGALVWGRPFGVAGPAGIQYQQHDTYRLNLGLSGEFAGNTGYDLSVTWGHAKGDYMIKDTRTDHLAYAYRGLGGPDCDRDAFYADPAGSGIEPGSGNLGQGDCFYYNPFTSGYPASQSAWAFEQAGPGSENPALHNAPGLEPWLIEFQERLPETEQFVAGLVFDGQTGLFDRLLGERLANALLGGDVNWAVGMQYRKDKYKVRLGDNTNLAVSPCAFDIQAGASFTIPDTPINGGADTIPGWTYNCLGIGRLNFLSGDFPFSGSQDVYALFGELQIPLWDSVDVQLALRYEDYGGKIGNTLDPKLATIWEVNSHITLRGSISTSFRAPTLNQSGGQFTTLSFVPPTLAFKAVDTRGNPDLAPEEALSTNFGVILYPNENSRLSLDYWYFDLSKPIILETFNDIVNNCSGDSAIQELACSKITFRDPDNPTLAGIERIAVDYQNGPDTRTHGLDLDGSYDFVTEAGIITVGGQVTWINAYKVDAWIWADKLSAAGQLNADTSTVRSLPDLKGSAYINWSKGGHNLRLESYYTGSYDDSRTIVPPDTRVDDHLTFDIHYNFRFNDDNTRLFASVVNITNEDPPQTLLDLNYDPYTHNPYGTIIKVGLQHRFDGGIFSGSGRR